MIIRCGSNARRSVVRNHFVMNGIDYLEVITKPGPAYPRPLLVLHCFKPISGLGKNQVIIKGGVRIKNVGVEWARPLNELSNLRNEGKISEQEFNTLSELKEHDNALIIRPTSPGDFSTYELALVDSLSSLDVPAANFDPVLFKAEFSFKVECPSDFDCACKRSDIQRFSEPTIDYLAKDYSSFRRLLLDRLSLLAPEWKERNVSDMGVMLVELLSYVGDHLSYYQDAVSTEAYLGTARSRISAARHSRLLDYFMQDGCNARAWVCMKVTAVVQLEAKTMLLADKSDDSSSGPVIYGDEIEEQASKGSEVFETMQDITLYKSKNEIHFYTWNETDCWLPKGSTSAAIAADTLESEEAFVWEDIPSGKSVSGEKVERLVEFLEKNFSLDWLALANISKQDEGTMTREGKITISFGENLLILKLRVDYVTLSINGESVYEFQVNKEERTGKHKVLFSTLQVGDVLIFEEIKAPAEGSQPDSSHRHPVRLTSVERITDDLTQEKVLKIQWDFEDALPFSLCLVKDGKELSIIYANVVLADHGYTTIDDPLELYVSGGRYYPALQRKPLTQAGPSFDSRQGSKASAASVFSFDPEAIRPAITLMREGEAEENELAWKPQKDLLSSDEFAREFVVETETDGTSHIRFANGSRKKWANDLIESEEATTLITRSFKPFKAVYRIGSGERGNVGPYSIRRIFSTVRGKFGENIESIFNPMAAAGGKDLETLSSARLHAPQAFRKQERAVTESDYVDVLRRHPQVQHAVAVKRWTGSWYTIFVTIDRKGGLEVDSQFKEHAVRHLERYRMAGYDIEVNGPQYVPIKIEMNVCLKEGHFEGEVKEALYEAFSTKMLKNGKNGFFHPDNFTFGQSLYLSKVYEAAMAVEGVSSVNVSIFQRWGKVPGRELQDGVIKTGTLEIIRLDNDPNFAENGMLEVNICRKTR